MGFGDCWERVRQATRLKKQTELASFLEISSSNISEAKIKDRFPLHWAFKIAQDFKISTDWIMTGHGPKEALAVFPIPDEILSEEDLARRALDFIMKNGNTYQRGVVKGYLKELAAEITHQTPNAGKNK